MGALVLTPVVGAVELGFLLGEVGASVVIDTEAVLFHFILVAIKSSMIVSDVSFANVPFLSAANAFAVSFFSTLTNSPSRRALFVMFSAVRDAVAACFAQSVKHTSSRMIMKFNTNDWSLISISLLVINISIRV